MENPWEEKHIGKRVGANLRKIRVHRGLSMEALANRVGVSKVTLVKIENGEANPTLSVIWKIANGLSVPVTALLSVETDVAISRKRERVGLSDPDDVFVVEPVFRSDQPHVFELYWGYMQPHSTYRSEAHAPGVVEFITVMSGRLDVEIEGERYQLDEHDAIRFNGDVAHHYINPSSSPAVLHFVISYNHPVTRKSVWSQNVHPD
jgi:XRE family transcriptional regulator, regulator of sulfur utilization